jgi:SET domain-containing protein
VVLVGEIAKTIDKLKDLIFELDKNKEQWGLVLGYGSLYRHSDKPNLDYAYNPKSRQMYFITNRPIKMHEELTINYGSDYWAERTNFNTVAEIPSVNQGLEPLAKPENESQIQQNAADIDSNATKMAFGQPNSNMNPAVSGKPILGIGQQ